MKGTWREGYLAREPEGYAEKVLEMDISFHRGAVFLGNLEEGSSTEDFERRMKGALGMGLLSLIRLRGGPQGRGLYRWGPWKICSDSLWIWALLPMGAPIVPRETWCLGGARIPGILKDG